MAKFKNIEVKDWVAARILYFFNVARDVSDIVDHPDLKDNPENGTNGVTIGPTVAKRILERKQQLQFRRFRNISKLEGIQGFGEDKFNDLIYSFGSTAAEAFRQGMFNGVILDNWRLDNQTIAYKDEASFLKVANNESMFRELIAAKLQETEIAAGKSYQEARYKALLVQKSYLEVFDIAHYGAIAFGFYFYQFDADNWFSFDRVRLECEKYLSYHPSHKYRLELRLFKGFQEAGLRSTSTTQGMIPVVVNYGEQSIDIWEAELFD